MFSAYLEKDIYEKICVFDDHPNWKKILLENTQVLLNLTDEELEAEFKDEDGYIFNILKAYEGFPKPIALSSHFSVLNEDISQVKEHPNSAYILDVTEDEAKDAKDSYGVLVLSNKNLKDSQFEYDFDLPLIEEENVDKGLWGKFGELYRKQCSNSVIFNDRNLFSNESHGKNPGTENIIKILDNFLPEKLAVEFYVLIITEQYTKPEKLIRLKKGIKGVNERVNGLRDYDIIIEVLTHHPGMDFYKYTHNRRILFNYHLGKVEHGLDLFSVSGELKGDHDDSFSLVSRFKNDSSLKQFDISLQRYVEMKDDAEKKLKEPGQNDRHYRLLRNGEEVNTIENRLLN